MTLSLPSVLALVLAAPSLFGAAIFTYILIAMRRTHAVLGVASDGLASSLNRSSPVWVIVPAHNEQAVIASLVASLRNQDYPAFRAVLALDRCTDSTLAVALETIGPDERFEVLEIASCPADWAGKVHAIHEAVTRQQIPADGVLVFADADTVLHPGCLRACVALLDERRLDALSLLSTLTYDQSFEKTSQAPASFELLVRYPPLKASRDHQRRPFANGQFIMMRQSAYQAIGTHAAFRDELLEDLAIARAIWQSKLRMQVLPAGNMMQCRMYPNAVAFRRGWKRIFIESAKRKPSRLRSWSFAALARGMLFPAWNTALLGASVAAFFLWPAAPTGAIAIAVAASAAGVAAWLAVIWLFLKSAGISSAARRVNVLLRWPLGSARLSSLLREAANELETGVPTAWAGRTYKRQSR